MSEDIDISNERIDDIAKTLGLELEFVSGSPDAAISIRVFKGANKIFTGREESVLEYFRRYERERPPLFSEGMYGYQE